MTDEHHHAADEVSLEPVSLIRASGASMRIGALMLAAGTASYRVKEAMRTTALALGIDRHTEHVTLTEITATSHRGAIFRTEVSEVRHLHINADRISALERLQGELKRPTTVDDLHVALDAIEQRKPLYPPWANALFAGFACAGFALLNNGRGLEVISVIIAATLGQWVRGFLARRTFNPFGTTMLAAAVASLIYLACIGGFGIAIDGADASAAGYVSAVLFLVPGFPVVTGALDLAKLDFSAGVSRVVFAVLILLSAALSIWGIAELGGLNPAIGEPLAISAWLLILIHLVASFVGVLGFALMFNSPIKMALTASCIGAVANVARIAMIDRGMAVQIATVIAAVLVGCAAAWAAPRISSPILTLNVPSVLLMVPGVSGYRSIVEFNRGETLAALDSGVQAILVIVSIAVGLVLAKLITDRDWSSERR